MKLITKKVKIVMKNFLLIFACIAFSQLVKAQQGFGTNAPDKSAIIDMVNPNPTANAKGVLMPRVALKSTTDVVTVPLRVNALTVFNTATAGTGPNDVTPGYYYWSSADSKWIRLLSTIDSQEPWYNMATNTGANANTQNIYQLGRVGINTANPVGQLHVVNPNYATQSVFESTNSGLLSGIAAGSAQFLYNTLGSSIASYTGSGIGKVAPYNGMSTGFNFAFKSNADALKDVAAINAGLVDYANGKGQLNFIVNGSGTALPSMVLASNGYLGIGTVTPATPNAPPTNPLHIKATTDPIRLEGLQAGSITTDNIISADATGVLKIVKGAMPKFFYAPSVVIPTHTSAGVVLSGTQTLDVYSIYAQQFGFTAGTGQARSNGASNLPVLPANQLDYFITYFDTNVFNTVSVSTTGVISYTVKTTAVATEAAFMNIVFKVQD